MSTSSNWTNGILSSFSWVRLRGSIPISTYPSSVCSTLATIRNLRFQFLCSSWSTSYTPFSVCANLLEWSSHSNTPYRKSRKIVMCALWEKLWCWRLFLTRSVLKIILRFARNRWRLVEPWLFGLFWRKMALSIWFIYCSCWIIIASSPILRPLWSSPSSLVPSPSAFQSSTQLCAPRTSLTQFCCKWNSKEDKKSSQRCSAKKTKWRVKSCSSSINLKSFSTVRNWVAWECPAKGWILFYQRALPRKKSQLANSLLSTQSQKRKRMKFLQQEYPSQSWSRKVISTKSK